MSEPINSHDNSNLSVGNIDSIRKCAMEAITLCQRLIINHEKNDNFENVEITEQIIKSNFKILASIANSIEFCKLDDYKPKVFNLSQYLSDFVYTCRSVLRGKGIDINCECDRDIFVNADPDRLLACLLSLMVNSVQHVDDDEGEIKIKATKLMDSVSITIIDDGYGMDSSELSKVIDYNRNRGGLAIVNKFCHVIGSTLITDTAPDGGFTASFRLPLAECSCLSSSQPLFPITTFSPFNIYLSKISDAILQFC